MILPMPHETTLPRRIRRIGFFGLAVSQFLGAFNDNAFKMLIILASANLAGSTGRWSKEDLLQVTGVLMMVPFMLFSLPGGTLADRFSKRTVLIGTKFLEIAVMSLAVLAFATRHVEIVLFIFFLLLYALPRGSSYCSESFPANV